MSAELEQGTEAWMLARCGYIGASELGMLMAKGEGKTRAALIKRKAAERLSGKPQGWEGNGATEVGHEQEPFARRAYEERTGAFVVQAGFIRHPAMPYTGASPDGLVDDDGGCEFKSHVRLVTHLDAITGGIPIGHTYQCQWGMACSGRAFWDYGHWMADAPENIRLFMWPRLERDEVMIDRLAAAIREANDEINAMVEKYQRMGVSR